MNPLVSVIVPVYNGERVVERCLCSLRAQTYDNLEFIIINDGSTDHTEQILDKYASLDSRFRVMHVENAGVSEARNLGLSIANGVYAQFVDCDDWLTNDATSSLVTAILNNCEMVICNYNRVVERNIVVRGHSRVEGRITSEDYALLMMKAPANYYYGVLWNKLFRLDIIREHHILFPKERDFAEDFQFNLEYLKYVNHVYVLQRELYYYVLTRGSLSAFPFDVKEVINMKTALFEYYKSYYESIDLYDNNKMIIRRFYLDFARDKIKGVKIIRGVNVKDATQNLKDATQNVTSKQRKRLQNLQKLRRPRKLIQEQLSERKFFDKNNKE